MSFENNLSYFFLNTLTMADKAILERKAFEAQLSHEMGLESFDERRVHQLKAQIIQLEKQVCTFEMFCKQVINT